jgi:hypothetical protein
MDHRIEELKQKGNEALTVAKDYALAECKSCSSLFNISFNISPTTTTTTHTAFYTQALE